MILESMTLLELCQLLLPTDVLDCKINDKGVCALCRIGPDVYRWYVVADSREHLIKRIKDL